MHQGCIKGDRWFPSMRLLIFFALLSSTCVDRSCVSWKTGRNDLHAQAASVAHAKIDIGRSPEMCTIGTPIRSQCLYVSMSISQPSIVHVPSRDHIWLRLIDLNIFFKIQMRSLFLNPNVIFWSQYRASL